MKGNWKQRFFVCWCFSICLWIRLCLCVIHLRFAFNDKTSKKYIPRMYRLKSLSIRSSIRSARPRKIIICMFTFCEKHENRVYNSPLPLRLFVLYSYVHHSLLMTGVRPNDARSTYSAHSNVGQISTSNQAAQPLHYFGGPDQSRKQRQDLNLPFEVLPGLNAHEINRSSSTTVCFSRRFPLASIRSTISMTQKQRKIEQINFRNK